MFGKKKFILLGRYSHLYLTEDHWIMYFLSLCIVVHDTWTEVAWFQQLQDQSRDIFS